MTTAIAIELRVNQQCLALWLILCAALACVLTESAHAEPPDSLAATAAAAVVLQLNEDVEIGSTIVRLGDVLSPVGAAPEGWERASATPIGLLPADGRRLRIDRQRLLEMLGRLKLISPPVRITGAESVGVRYVAAIAPAADLASAAVTDAAPPAEGQGATPQNVSVRRTSYAADDGSASGAYAGNRRRTGAAPLVPAEKNRLRRMIEAAFEQRHTEIVATAELRIDEADANLALLDGLREITDLRLSGAPGDEDLRLMVGGVSERGPVEATIRIELVDLPMVVVTTRTLNRGEIVSPRDLRLEAIPRQRYADDLVTRVDSIVGMEVKRPISDGRTIRWEDVTAPIVIRRGEMVELRVVGAGVTVTTNARALASAAAGEPVTVETLSPRRKHLARAAASGVVEIVTRPPTTADSARPAKNR